MSTPALIPVDEYLRHSEKPNCEYREGVLSLKTLPTKLHSIMQRALLAMLQSQPKTQAVQAFPELTLQISPTRFLVPDVAVADDFPGPYPTEPVRLCAEILSPEDRLGAMLSKCEEYHAWGVPFCWVIGPVKRTAWEYHAAAEPERATTALRAGDLSISLEELFASLDTAR